MEYVRMKADGTPETNQDGNLITIVRKPKNPKHIAKHNNGQLKLIPTGENTADINLEEREYTGAVDYVLEDGKLIKTKKHRKLTQAKKDKREKERPGKDVADLQVQVNDLEGVMTKVLLALQQHEDPANLKTIINTTFQENTW